MNTKRRKDVLRNSVAFAVAGWVLTVGPVALADETVVVSTSAPEKTSGLYNAFEIGLGFGYTQGLETSATASAR